MRRRLFFGAQRAIEVAGGRAAVDKKRRTRDKCALVAHEKLGNVRDFIGCTGSAGRALCKHIFVEIAANTVELIYRERGNDYSGEMAFTRAPLSPHFTDSAITRFSLQRFAS